MMDLRTLKFCLVFFGLAVAALMFTIGIGTFYADAIPNIKFLVAAAKFWVFPFLLIFVVTLAIFLSKRKS